jgi:hypothetical protein
MMKGVTMEAKIETAKAAPALAGATYSMLTLNEWVAVVTILYVLMQMAYLVWKWWHEAKAKRNRNG